MPDEIWPSVSDVISPAGSSIQVRPDQAFEGLEHPKNSREKGIGIYEYLNHGIEQLAALVQNAGGVVRLSSTQPRRVLWGAAPTGAIHLGYLGYFGLLHSMENAGIETIVVVADYHAYLDSEKSLWQDLDARTENYIATMEAVGLKNLVRTSIAYQEKGYLDTLIKLTRHLNVDDTLDAGRTTFQQISRNVGELLYVSSQISDIQHFEVDTVTCGLDESDIYQYGIPILSRLYDRPFSEWYLPMCPGLLSPEMHASDDIANKLLVTETPEELYTKLLSYVRSAKASQEGYPLLKYLDNFIFPIFQIPPSKNSKNEKSACSYYVDRLTNLFLPFAGFNH